MDLDDQVVAEEEWFTVGVSAFLCGVLTIVYLLSDFEDHQPLFYIFVWLSGSVLVVEYGDKLLNRVVGETFALKVKNTARSSTFSFSQGVNFLLQLRQEQRTTFFWTLNCVFVVLFCVSRQMDDASLIYAACMLLSSSPILRKVLGHSTKELLKRASRLFQPPATENTELADYMPNINEVSRDFSIRIRRNSCDNTITDHEMDISVFDESALRSMDTSGMSLLHESHLVPVMEQSMASSKATDDDTSPIPSDVEVIDADDIPEDFPSITSIRSGHLHSATGNYTSNGTLRRKDQKQNRNEMAS
jgi:hypothetical protein